MSMWIEKIVGDLGDKRRWREYRARMKALPEPYRRAGEGLQRYLLNLGPVNQSESLLAMVDDLAELLEQSAATGTPIRSLVGEDPAEFAEEFMQNYGGGSWIRTERARLAETIDEAEKEQTP